LRNLRVVVWIAGREVTSATATNDYVSLSLSLCQAIYARYITDLRETVGGRKMVIS